MKAKFEFDLPEDNYEFRLCSSSGLYREVIDELMNNLRSFIRKMGIPRFIEDSTCTKDHREIKYGNNIQHIREENYHKGYSDAVEDIQKYLTTLIEENNCFMDD